MDNKNFQNFDPLSTGTETKPPVISSSIGPLVGIIIVVIIIILGGMYFWGQRLDTTENLNIKNDAATQSLQNQDSSDEIGSIDVDVQATNLENLDSELNQMDAELQASGL